jgi:hypothetical protein
MNREPPLPETMTVDEYLKMQEPMPTGDEEPLPATMPIGEYLKTQKGDYPPFPEPKRWIDVKAAKVAAMRERMQDVEQPARNVRVGQLLARRVGAQAQQAQPTEQKRKPPRLPTIDDVFGN